MQQILHLLIVDRDRRTALVRWYGSRWLLPLIGCAERTRAGPLVSRWLLDRGLSGQFAGQWLGRFAPSSAVMDWLAVVDARSRKGLLTPPDLRWTSVDHIKGSIALVDYQQWSVATCLAGDLPTRPGPFGSLDWIDRVSAWIERVAGPLDGRSLCYRATPHEVVFRISAGGQRLFFKGLTGDRVVEALVTAKLSEELPDSFASTVALEQQDDVSMWWMTEECAGTPVTASDRAAALSVVSALARVQYALTDALPTFQLPQTDLQAAAEWARSLLAERRDRSDADACARSLASVCESVSGADLPRSWTPLDIDPGNVLVDGCHVRLIDLDRSHCGPAPLAAATLLRRLKRDGGSVDHVWIDNARRRYQRQWPRFEFATRWRDLELASTLLECHNGWQRLSQNVDRGEVTSVIDVAADRTSQRLVRALTTERR